MDRLFVALAVLLTCPVAMAASPEPDPGISWWDQQRRGANCQNGTVEPSYWQAAADAGIEYVRLAPDGWATERRDFLIGDADAYEGLETVDLSVLRDALDDAEAAGVKVVLTFFSLPGARWKQLNDDVDDYRLWGEQASRDQALAFWTDLATELAGHPAIVAYNPLNEPHPERGAGVQERGFDAWYEQARGTLADVNRFDREVVQAIRRGDPTTPILLDGGFYASPFGLSRLEPVPDDAVLYAFHYYEAWDYLTFRANDGRFSFPDRMPEGWTPFTITVDLERVAVWARTHAVDPRRIVAAEFGVDRRTEGAVGYLDHLLIGLEQRGWHWAFYAFRGDGSWGGLDYELGAAPFDHVYWASVAQGIDPERLKRRGPNPLWRVISRRLRGSAADPEAANHP